MLTRVFVVLIWYVIMHIRPRQYAQYQYVALLRPCTQLPPSTPCLHISLRITPTLQVSKSSFGLSLLSILLPLLLNYVQECYGKSHRVRVLHRLLITLRLDYHLACGKCIRRILGVFG